MEEEAAPEAPRPTDPPGAHRCFGH